MTVRNFARRRTTGLSNQEVVAEHCRRHPPGTTFTYEALAAVLSEGTDREFSRSDVQQVVRLAKMRLLRDHKRTLANVPRVGYQLAHARDHRGLAGAHTKRGQRQFKRALVTLENARLDEMTAAERELHLAQCGINQALYLEQQRILSKQARHDQLIARLAARVEQLEAGRAAGA